MKKEVADTFVSICIKKRKQMGYTQKEVAKNIGCSLSKYQRFEA